MESVEGIKGEVFSHLEKLFKEPDCSRPLLDGIAFISLTVSQSLLIEEPFLEVEIKADV